MGLFDPPTKSIAKRVPVSGQPLLASVQAFAEDAIPDHLGRTKKACLAAMVMGSWVNAHARFGTFDMSPRDAAYVQNMYSNCARMAGQDSYIAIDLISELFDRGLMPEGMPNIFKI